MSRYCDHDITAVLEAAAAWRDRCLLADGSILSEQALWVLRGLAELQRFFIEQPDATKRSFIEKLRDQLAPSAPQTKQLAAEMCWLLMLFPRARAMGVERKRELVTTVWAWSGEVLPLDQAMLRVPLEDGVGNPGTAYNTRRWAELAFLITAVHDLKARDRAEREHLLADPWQFAAWLDGVREPGYPQLRHILKFLLFPDHFERLTTGRDKRAILAAFTGKLARDVRNLPFVAIDKALYDLRQRLEQQHGTTALDFYYPPLRAQWKKNGGGVPPKGDCPYCVRHALADVFIEPSAFAEILDALKAKKNVILQGPPGVGKTFFSKRLAYALMGEKADARIGMVQFHPAYAYEDFVQGYRPTDGGLVLRNGIFFTFCRRATADPAHPYVFIIDEINRANLSKVFGELMMLLEADKRGPEWAIPLAYAGEADTPFFVPTNLYVIGLMNTADRSLAMVDYALRRRFAFVDLLPGFHTTQFRDHLQQCGVDAALIQRIVRKIGALNARITQDTTDLGAGFCIGHSFFCAVPGDRAADEIWYQRVIRSEIAPLLREYWFDDSTKAEELIRGLLITD